MIERKILYYPTILVPSRWLRWATLYWDKASSIVPYGWEDEPSLVHPSRNKHLFVMNYLWKEGLFQPTRPSDLLRSSRVGDVFADELRETVESVAFQARINRNWRRNPIDRIHREKMTTRALSFLHRSRLAKMDKQNPNWFFVEENTALLYMGLLAKHLADVDLDLTVPSTDRTEYETMVYGIGTKVKGFPSFEAKFLDLLPVPRDGVSIIDIVRFRRKRENELLQFREIMDEVQKEASNAKSEADLKEIFVQKKEKIQKERSKLRESMKDFGIKTALATIKSLISIKSPAILGTLAFSAAKTPASTSVPIIILTAFAQVGYVWVDNRNKQRAEIRESPFAYLYYAEKQKLLE